MDQEFNTLIEDGSLDSVSFIVIEACERPNTGYSPSLLQQYPNVTEGVGHETHYCAAMH